MLQLIRINKQFFTYIFILGTQGKKEENENAYHLYSIIRHYIIKGKFIREQFCSQIQLSNFRALERRLHKISKPSEIRNEYFSSLKNYKECISTLLYNDYEFKCFCDAHRQDCSDLIHCFENPLEYFVMADKTLKLIPYPHISFINIPAAFQALRLPITQNNVLEKRLINSLKRYLNYNIPLYFRTLYKYRFYDLKDRNILAQGSQITPFDAPENSFFTICGNLFTYCEDYLICLSTNSIK